MRSPVMEPNPTEIIRRRVNIAFDSSKARGWHLRKKTIEDFLNAISFLFPPGERFFIQSVQSYRDRISDPVLIDQVKRFVYQEAMHTKEHARCNGALSQAFPHGKKIEDLAAKGLGLIQRFTPKATQLAVTCALEHFTAILADSLLRGQEIFIRETDPSFAALWLWHAVEESEHKAVCFDVYQTVCGKGMLSYLHRVMVMFLTSVNFFLTAVIAVLLVKRKSGNNEEKSGQTDKAQSEAPPAPWRNPGMLRGLLQILPLKLYFDYYRPSFHPWDHNNLYLIEEWKRRYKDFGEPDTAPAS